MTATEEKGETMKGTEDVTECFSGNAMYYATMNQSGSTSTVTEE